MSEASSEPGSGAGRAEPAVGHGSGVLGNLPRSRPSVRSPRRAAARPNETAPGGGGDEGPAGTEGSDRAPPEIEALARGGLALAGGAASLGLRFAGRAAAAVRGAVERR